MKRNPVLIGMFVLMALIAMLTSPVWAQQPQPQPLQPRPQQGPPAPLTILPGRGLAGITIGTSIRLVIARFGNPSFVRETTLDVAYAWNRWGIVVYTKDDLVTAVSTTNSLLKIDEVLGVGYRAESAIAAYGRTYKEGPVEGFPGLVYEDKGVAFGMDGTAIAIVLVFRPGQAASVSGLQPAQAVRPSATPAVGLPQVTGLDPFGQQTNYMSLPGYLRWVAFQTSGVWLAYPEAARIVKDQLAGH